LKGVGIKRDMHIKSGDTVYIISGKEKGKTGKVLRVIKNEKKAIVEKLNVAKKHSKPTQKNPTGGITDVEKGIDVSNILLYCSKCKKPSRSGIRKISDTEKVRYCKRCNEEFKA
jgi:large subunit ribosomal protein L24